MSVVRGWTSIVALLAAAAMIASAGAEPVAGAVVVETTRGTYNTAFAWSTTTTQNSDGSGNVVHADGFPFARHVPLVAVRLGERLRIRSLHPIDDIAVRYGRRLPVSLGSARTVSWRVPASGTYLVAITVTSSSPKMRSTAEYVIRLRARRS